MLFKDGQAICDAALTDSSSDSEQDVARAWDVVVIGAGAAGLLAAARAAERGRRVILLEKNRKTGVKILMSGGTRCNLTHAVDAREIVAAFGRQGAFLHSALAALDPAALVQLFEDEGVATKTEPGGKIFPASDRAIDVRDALGRRVKRSGAELVLDEAVRLFRRSPGEPNGFEVETNQQIIRTGHIILATGGRSYPDCGTTGDGYAWAKELGHSIVPTRPALVPLTVGDEWIKSLQGVTAPDVAIWISEKDGPAHHAKKLRTETTRRGSFLFTHFGVSGPVVLDVSRFVVLHERPNQLELVCDFLPSVSTEELDRQLQKNASEQGRRPIAELLPAGLPRRLAEALVERAGLPKLHRASALTRDQRQNLARFVKRSHLEIRGTRGFKKAEVTTGGVLLKEIDSRTMHSKVVPGLFMAGEVLDLDGPIGGYNFQAAFSTGWLAGSHA